MDAGWDTQEDPIAGVVGGSHNRAGRGIVEIDAEALGPQEEIDGLLGGSDLNGFAQTDFVLRLMEGQRVDGAVSRRFGEFGRIGPGVAQHQADDRGQISATGAQERRTKQGEETRKGVFRMRSHNSALRAILGGCIESLAPFFW